MIDTKVSYVLRPLIYLLINWYQVVGMNWIEVPAGKYNILSDNAKRSHCQIEFSVRWVHSSRIALALLVP